MERDLLRSSGLLSGAILAGTKAKRPGDRFIYRFDAGRHAQVILARRRRIAHPHIVGDPLRIAWQLYRVQRSPWPTVDQCSTNLLDKSRAHAFLDDAAYLD